MRRSIALCLTLAVTVLFGACSSMGTAPGKSGAPTLTVLGATSFTSGDVFQALPPGDMIMTVDAGTLLNTTIPGMLANQPDQKAKFEANMKEMVAKTGVDAKDLKLVAVSMKFPPAGTSGEPQFAAVITGSFDTAKLTESLKKDPKTNVERPTEEYNGKTMYVIDKKSDGSSDASASKSSDPADKGGVAILDNSTIAFGGPISQLKAAIDAQAKTADNATKDADLFGAFKSTKDTSLLRFAMRVPADQMKKESTDPITESFAKAKYFFGSLDGANGLGLELTARAGSAEDAKPMYDNLTKAIDEGKQKMAGAEGLKSLLTVLESIKVTNDGADVKVAVAVTTDQMNQIGKDLAGMFGGAMGGGPGSSMDHDSMKDMHDELEKKSESKSSDDDDN